jgi:mutator protein MutT
MTPLSQAVKALLNGFKMEAKLNIAVTAIIVNKENKVLITKRSGSKKKWPGKWTVPGGKLEMEDFIGTPTEINNQWYNTLENCVIREVREEVGLEINNIEYLCNIAIPDTLIISFVAQARTEEVKLQEEEADAYAWVGLDDLDKYDIIDGIADEIIEALWQTLKH